MRQIYKKVLQSENILLVPHQNPDADALGSVTAFMEFLDSLDKKYRGFSATEIPPKLFFIPNSEKCTFNKKILKENFDLIIIFDTGSPDYAGLEKYLKETESFVINIDHHPTNTFFGDLNLVNTESCSTTELLFNFFKVNNIKINCKMASSLLAGIITDTDRFQNSNTTSDSIKITSELLELGANLSQIKKNLYTNKTINSLKIWGTILSRLTKKDEYSFAYTYLKKTDLVETGATPEDVENVGNFMNSISDAKIRLILKEADDGFVKGSFRGSNDENVDVAKYAKKLGGGGHKKAAGFKIKGTVEEVLKKVFNFLKEEN
ncbi:MAG: bifunctional oligoribonuclease/PAP phosphatase NrnA [Candidatus Magasanikbacteria bacterium]|nr:bifunctional oligoribonuclease/PAP phosphatase NrnA [Candidatus Magasanikbacteria bacterium]